jgi:hypothetical protein
MTFPRDAASGSGTVGFVEHRSLLPVRVILLSICFFHIDDECTDPPALE